MARVDAQSSQIQRYQELEAASALERGDLQEQLEQAQKGIRELEAKLTVTAEAENLPGPTAKNIVSFATIEANISPQRDMSPCEDPADFAMLFASDNSCAPSPNAKDTQRVSANAERIPSQQKQQPESDHDDGIFDIPDMDQPQFTRKRKAVNFEVQHAGNDVKRTTSTLSSSTQAPGGPEERPSKEPKHVHKWTYSRIRTSSTQVQEEQSTVSARAAVSERRASPKSLVSASSGNHAAVRPNTRSRGRRRSRGMMAADLGPT